MSASPLISPRYWRKLSGSTSQIRRSNSAAASAYQGMTRGQKGGVATPPLLRWTIEPFDYRRRWLDQWIA